MTRPLDVSAEEFTARLERETDASLRQDPTRWVVRPASGGSRRPPDRPESGITAYARDARRDRDRDTWDDLIDGHGRGDLGYDPREAGRKSWETRRARAQASPSPDPS